MTSAATRVLWIVATLPGAGASPIAQRAPKPDDPPPNFVVFLTDDLGWGDLGCYGHPRIESPNLDRFARQGLRFTQCYAASSVCSPSRSAILTGRTPYRNGVFTWIPAGRDVYLRASEITIAELLKERGYATCHVGKWHLNGRFNEDAQPQPDDHGYDWWLATQNNAAPSHRDPTNFVRNGTPVGPVEGYSAALVVDEAIGWLQRRHGAGDDAPFFLAVWTHEPHLPIESDPQLMARYDDVEDAGVRQHHGNVTQIDHAFGRLMTALDELGHDDDTFVVFTSDNGPEGDGTKGRARGSTGGLRGRKRAMYEGGIRVPGIVRWPGRVEPGTASAEPVIGSDIFTTICEVAKVPVPDDRTIDGASMLPVFAGRPIERAVPMYWRWFGAPHGLQIAMRQGDLKILASEDLSRFELYDVEHDPREQRDLAETEPRELAAMRAALVGLNRQIEAEGPDWWRDYRPRRGGRGRPVRTGPLPDGEDRTGSFAAVKGGSATASGSGVELSAAGEAIALYELAEPEMERIELDLRYRTLRNSGTRNGCLVFGASDRNDDLVKVGSMIGMRTHGIFRGSWANLQRGALVERDYDQAKTIAATATVDLRARTITAVIDATELSWPLPKDVARITHYGYYVKGTASSFGPITVRRGRARGRAPAPALASDSEHDRDSGQAMLTRGALRAVVADNRAFGARHRAGYSGIAELRPGRGGNSPFVPEYSGLNFEHIFSGDATSYGWNIFEPRRAPMQLVQPSARRAELQQERTEHWPLRTVVAYELVDADAGAGADARADARADAIDFEVRCVPLEDAWHKHGYIGVFFASYIDTPEDRAIHFIGRSRPGAGDPTPRWIRHVPPRHGEDACHRPAGSGWDPPADRGLPITLVSGTSPYEYLYPFYYGVIGGKALVFMFERPDDDVAELRFAQSPTGGGPTNPAWDFVYLRRRYEVGTAFGFRGRLVFQDFDGVENVIRAYEA